MIYVFLISMQFSNVINIHSANWKDAKWSGQPCRMIALTLSENILEKRVTCSQWFMKVSIL